MTGTFINVGAILAGTLVGVIVGRRLPEAGGVLIIGISLKLLELTDVKVGNFLPALVFAPARVGIVSAID